MTFSSIDACHDENRLGDAPGLVEARASPNSVRLVSVAAQCMLLAIADFSATKYSLTA